MYCYLVESLILDCDSLAATWFVVSKSRTWQSHPDTVPRSLRPWSRDRSTCLIKTCEIYIQLGICSTGMTMFEWLSLPCSNGVYSTVLWNTCPTNHRVSNIYINLLFWANLLYLLKNLIGNPRLGMLVLHEFPRFNVLPTPCTLHKSKLRILVNFWI